MENTEFKITFRKRAAKEYIEAVLWYKERSLKAAEDFNEEVQNALSKIVLQPDYFH